MAPSNKNTKRVKNSSADFFQPTGNEEELTLYAESLGITNYIFLYPMKEYVSQTKKLDGEVKTGIYLPKKTTLKEFQKAKQMSSFVVLEASENLRTFLEKGKSFFVVGCEFHQERDFIHQRNSGLNHILLAIAKKNSISFVFPFSKLLLEKPLMQTKIFGRLRQNLFLCKKMNIAYSLFSFAKTPLEIKKDLDVFSDLLTRNKT